MNKTRYWLTEDRILVREWNQYEYDSLEPTTRIQEDVLWNVCINCGYPFSIATHIVKDANDANALRQLCSDCRKKQNRLFFKPKNRNNGYAYFKTELRCFESGCENIDGKQCFVNRMY